MINGHFLIFCVGNIIYSNKWAGFKMTDSFGPVAIDCQCVVKGGHMITSGRLLALTCSCLRGEHTGPVFVVIWFISCPR